jgi:hypothetical protein
LPALLTVPGSRSNSLLTSLPISHLPTLRSYTHRPTPPSERTQRSRLPTRMLSSGRRRARAERLNPSTENRGGPGLRRRLPRSRLEKVVLLPPRRMMRRRRLRRRMTSRCCSLGIWYYCLPGAPTPAFVVHLQSISSISLQQRVVSRHGTSCQHAGSLATGFAHTSTMPLPNASNAVTA